MMYKKGFLFILIVLMIGLTACSGTENSEENDDEIKWVDVKMKISPENPQPNETVTFQAEVTYGDEIVTDANDVSFEIWRANDEKHQEFEIKKATNGVYHLEKSFDREGTYYIISHVQAKSMHNMPKTEFVIGNPSEPEQGKTKSQVMELEDSGEQSK